MGSSSAAPIGATGSTRAGDSGTQAGFNFRQDRNRAMHEGSYSSAKESLLDHFSRHGAEVGARDVAEYLRRAEEFATNPRRAERFPVEGSMEGVVRYVKR